MDTRTHELRSSSIRRRWAEAFSFKRWGYCRTSCCSSGSVDMCPHCKILTVWFWNFLMKVFKLKIICWLFVADFEKSPLFRYRSGFELLVSLRLQFIRSSDLLRFDSAGEHTDEFAWGRQKKSLNFLDDFLIFWVYSDNKEIFYQTMLVDQIKSVH